MSRVLEILRWAGVSAAVFAAYQWGADPVSQFDILCVITVLSLAGLTGLESVFFAKQASEASGYGEGGRYQRQSGLNNLALAVTTGIIYLLGWGIYAKLTVMTVLLTFFTLSAANHTISIFRDKNYAFNNLIRPVLTAALLILVIPFMVRALAASG